MIRKEGHNIIHTNNVFSFTCHVQTIFWIESFDTAILMAYYYKSLGMVYDDELTKTNYDDVDDKNYNPDDIDDKNDDGDDADDENDDNRTAGGCNSISVKEYHL